MLQSKSCKTINDNFLLKKFGLTFFDRFKTGTYLVNWFGRYRCRFIGRSLILMYFYRDTHPFSSSLPDLLLQRRKLMKNPYVYPNDDKMMKWGDFYLIIISRDVGMWGKYFFKNVKQQDWKWILMLTASSRF